MKSLARARFDQLCLVLTFIALILLLMPLTQNSDWARWLNLAHVPGFALLAWVWAEDLLGRDWPRGKRLVVVALVGLLVAATTEGLQALIPGRYADLGDMLRNTLGIVLGLVLHFWRPGLFVGSQDTTTD